MELLELKLLGKGERRTSWKDIKAGKRLRGWLRRQGEGCCGDEEVRGQRSAPLVISPEPERQSRPGQRRFRCQRETADWRDQAGLLLCFVPVGPFILPSLPLPVTPLWPIPPFLQPLPSSLSVYPQNPNPVILSSTPSFPPNSPSFSPLKLNITTGFHSAGQADRGSSLWGCVSSVHHHVLTLTRKQTCTCCSYMHTGCWHVHVLHCQCYRNIWTIWVWREFFLHIGPYFYSCCYHAYRLWKHFIHWLHCEDSAHVDTTRQRHLLLAKNMTPKMREHF